MTKKILLLPICGLTATAVAQADYTNNELYLFLGVTSGTTSVSTSMHDAGSAAASYTLGSGGNSGVQTTAGTPSRSGGGNSSAAYEQDKPSSSSSNTSRPSSGSRSSGSGARYSDGGGTSVGSGYDDGGSGKGGIPIGGQASSPLTFTVTGGYQSDYVYHGLSQIGNATIGTTNPIGMYFVGVGAQYKGFNLGLKYVRSDVSDLNPRFNPTKSESYTEVAFDINYTLGLIAGPQGAGNWLDVTLGYQLLSFGEDTFWNTGEQHEFYGKLSMNRYKWVRPSISYHNLSQGDALNSGTTSPGVEILDGQQIIFQIDGSGVVYDAGQAQFGVGYYAQVGYDKGYNGGNTSFKQDWYQYGVSFPIFMGDFTVTPSANYTHRSDNGVSKSFWWGINAKYAF